MSSNHPRAGHLAHAILTTWLLGLGACGPSSPVERDLGPPLGGVLRPPARDAGSDAGIKPTATDAGRAGESPSTTPRDGSPAVDGAPAPGNTSAPSADCAALPAWKAGATIAPDDRVRHGDPARIYKCRPWPQGLWCTKSTYEPTIEPGAWADAWIDEGPCH